MMGSNYYGWNYGGVVDHFAGYYSDPATAYSMAQAAVAYPTNVHYSSSQYGPYGTIVASPVVQNVQNRGRASDSEPYRGQTTGQPSCYQDGAQQQAGKSGSQRADQTSDSNIFTDQSAAKSDATAVSQAYTPVLYNAAKNYLEERQTGGKKFWGGLNKDRFRSGRGPVIDPQQWKYCELCKCTCAGEQAYKAHLVGKAHKKKEAVGPSTAVVLAGSKGHMYCQLCEVSCSSSDAYAAHIKGAKHLKIMKVQMKMGKTIPEVQEATEKPAKIVKTSQSGSIIPRMNFVGGMQLNSTSTNNTSFGTDASSGEVDDDKIIDDPSLGPIGLEYILESMNETNTAPMFYCKLCDCSFSDPLAKLMHSKGRRHRLQYKKKVDPTLKVEFQVSYSERTKNQWKGKRRDSSDTYRQQAEALRYEKELLEWQLMKTNNPDFALQRGNQHPMAAAANMQGNVNSARDNQHIMAKHGEIYPTEEELEAVQKFVSTCERSLKLVSDKLAAGTTARVLKGVMRVGLLAKGLLLKGLLHLELVILTSEKPTKKLLQTIATEMPEQIQTFCDKKFKVELSSDTSHLIVGTVDDKSKEESKAAEGEDTNIPGFASEDSKETVHDITCFIFVAPSSLYEKQKAELLKMKSNAADKSNNSDDKSAGPSNLSNDGVQIEGAKKEDVTTEEVIKEEDYVDENVTNWALTELKRTKWFQSNTLMSPSCTVVIRILMDFCKRIPTWTPLGQWALELLVERCMSGEFLTPANGLRKAFEVVSSGIFLQDGWGLADECEHVNAPVDAVAHMCSQEREDITNSAQHALRLLALGKIHKVLGIAKLPPPPLMCNMPKKRPRTEDW